MQVDRDLSRLLPAARFPPPEDSMPTPNSAAARDIATMIHPYTNLDAHRTVGPMIVNRGEGVYIFDDEGKRYLDGMAALWSASLGFSEKRLVAAATKQMEQLPYSSIF